MSISTRYAGQLTFAAAMAWVWPGLGHIIQGERRRGLLVMFGVLFLFLGGVLIGGVDSVDRRSDPLWFFAQVLCGPIALAADAVNQSVNSLPADWSRLYERGDTGVRSLLRRKGLAHVNEIGTLYSALAGLMNLAAILDALNPPYRRAESRRRPSTDP